MKRTTLLMYFVVMIIPISTSLGNERKFSYVYESSVLPTGARELEVWNTYRYGKESYFRALDQRLEFEIGITNKLMTAFYINYQSTVADSNGTTSGGILQSEQTTSISSEWKYKLFDRVADIVGLSLYGEYTLGLNVSELEGKLILDKQIGKFLAAANIVAANEWKTELQNSGTRTESEFELELSGGISYSVTNNFSFGAESFIRNLYVEKIMEHSSLFAGPVISYAQDNWWVTLTLMPQLTSFTGPSKGSVDLDEFERAQVRLLFSFHL